MRLLTLKKREKGVETATAEQLIPPGSDWKSNQFSLTIDRCFSIG
jgi:hypothetical protein